MQLRHRTWHLLFFVIDVDSIGYIKVCYFDFPQCACIAVYLLMGNLVVVWRHVNAVLWFLLSVHEFRL